MKKVFVILFLLFIASAACRNKEAPQSPGQAGALRSQEELKMLQDAARAAPGSVEAWINLGNYLMDESRFNEAVDAYQKAIAIDPRNVDVRVDMGTCYRGSGRPDMAVKEYRKAIELNPNHPNAHRNLGVVLSYDIKDREQGIRELETYLHLSPNAPDSANIKREIDKLRSGKS